MKIWLRICAWMLLILGMAVPGQAREEARQFIAAMEAYQQQDFQTAIDGLEAIADSGVVNGQLFYNLGNAYLKHEDLGRAILWYERALALQPGDPDLRFNYDYARSLTQDAEEADATPLVRIFFFWKYALSARTIIVLATGFNLLFWSLALTWRLTRRRGLRHAALAALLPALALISTAGVNYYQAARPNQAIVLPAKISVRSGLEKTSTELFVLHAGAKVTLVRQMPGHAQVRFSKDKMGWISRQAIGLI